MALIRLPGFTVCSDRAHEKGNRTVEDDKQFTATFTVAEARALLQQLPQDTDQSEAYKNARLVLLLGIKAAK